MIINEIKPNTDSYKPHEVTCFEKPLGIAVESYLHGGGSIFYLILKYYQTYKVHPEDSLGSDLTLSLNIIKKYLNLTVNTIKPSKKLEDFIIKNIKKNHRVIVPCNLKKLFYSTHYEQNDWPHLLLIKGFDVEKKIFYILDDTHLLSDKSQYTNFMIPSLSS